MTRFKTVRASAQSRQYHKRGNWAIIMVSELDLGRCACEGAERWREGATGGTSPTLVGEEKEALYKGLDTSPL